ncbi:MAG TPA: C40 family peptidase [Gemmatimonadales bacterium]|nr:C40 family peptidase [Gemmatimonadales bacterium]
MTLRLPPVLLAAVFLAAAPAPLLHAQSSFARADKPFTAISRMFLPHENRDSLIDLARDQVGTRYKWGASTPGKAFDCSGLVQWLLANFDVELPRTSREQARIGLEIPRDPNQLLPGDLLFFGKGRGVDHVGIYIGDGRYVHASNSRKGVIESNLPRTSSSWWKGARRLFTTEEEVESDLKQFLRSPVLLPVISGA